MYARRVEQLILNSKYPYRIDPLCIRPSQDVPTPLRSFRLLSVARRRHQSVRPNPPENVRGPTDAVDAPPRRHHRPPRIDGTDLRRPRRALTPSPPSRRRSRAARRSRRTSTSATRRPRPNTSARPSSRPSVWRTRRRRSRRSLAKNWRRCCTRSTWRSARRRCASRRAKADPPHLLRMCNHLSKLCTRNVSKDYGQGEWI